MITNSRFSKKLLVDSEALKEAVQTAKSSSYQEALEGIKPLIEQVGIQKENQWVSKETDMSKNIVKQKVALNKVMGTISEKKADSLIEEVTEENGLKSPETITEIDLDEMLEEVEKETGLKSPSVDVNQNRPDPKMSVEETKKMLTTFHRKLSIYPKYVSYEGSMVLCVLLAMKKVVNPHISNLPIVDQQTIRSLLPEISAKALDYFSVRFDDDKDFLMELPLMAGDIHIGGKTSIEVSMFNSVVHPRQEDLNDTVNDTAGSVPIEDKGDKVSLGGKIEMDKRNIQKLMGIKNTYDRKYDKSDNEDTTPKRQPLPGRNAYELREDILSIAVDWVDKRPNYYGNGKDAEDEVMRVAKLFYSFVEDKRR